MGIKSFIKIFSSMNCPTISILSIIVFCFCTSLSIAQEKQKVNYKHLTYLPKGYDKDTSKYPLVIYLHGGSQKGNDLERLKVYGLPYLVDQGREFDFIMVAPQCPDRKYWSIPKDLKDAKNSIENQLTLTKSRKGAKVISEEFIDIELLFLPSLWVNNETVHSYSIDSRLRPLR